MNKVRISAVSYYNTLPLIHGILHSGFLNQYELHLDVPSTCARKLINDEADIALVPTGALPHIPGYRIITDFCIGAFGEVKTVLLLSNTPLSGINKIYLDLDSLTSVNLVKILSKRLWNIDPEWTSLDDSSNFTLTSGEGVVLIGDKAFGAEKRYLHCFDLAGEWYKLTQLPFVFAAWITKKEFPPDWIQQLNAALSWGVQHRKESISLARNLRISQESLINYLENDISFNLDSLKRNGMQLFLQYFATDLTDQQIVRPR